MLVSSKKMTNRLQYLFCQYNYKSYYAKEGQPLSYLQKVTYKDTIQFIPLISHGKVINIYDGNTITVASPLPFTGSPLYRFSVRLAGIDAPEIKGATPTEGALSCDALHRLLFGKIVELRNHGREKYGRLLADVYFHELHVNQWMIDRELAVKYKIINNKIINNKIK